MKSKISILLAVLALLTSMLACAVGAPAGVSNIYMANDKEGSNKTTTFASADTIYVFFDVNQVDSGTKFEIKWYALNVDGQDAATPFTTSDYTYSNESTLFAQIKSTSGGFPAGNYKVEIYMSGNKVGEQAFNVQ